MRTKVISILAIVALYFFVYIWSWLNIPLVKEATGLQELAFVGTVIFGTLGLLISLYHTIKWLLK